MLKISVPLYSYEVTYSTLCILLSGWVEVADMVFSMIMEDGDGIVQITRSVVLREELTWHALVSSCTICAHLYSLYMYHVYPLTLLKGGREKARTRLQSIECSSSSPFFCSGCAESS